MTPKEEEFQIDVDKGWVLMLHNDEKNSFDHVIGCLIEYCNHSKLQAAQCAEIAHNNGKTDITRGSIDEVIGKYAALTEEGLTVEVVKD